MSNRLFFSFYLLVNYLSVPSYAHKESPQHYMLPKQWTCEHACVWLCICFILSAGILHAFYHNCTYAKFLYMLFIVKYMNLSLWYLEYFYPSKISLLCVLTNSRVLLWKMYIFSLRIVQYFWEMYKNP